MTLPKWAMYPSSSLWNRLYTPTGVVDSRDDNRGGCHWDLLGYHWDTLLHVVAPDKKTQSHPKLIKLCSYQSKCSVNMSNAQLSGKAAHPDKWAQGCNHILINVITHEDIKTLISIPTNSDKYDGRLTRNAILIEQTNLRSHNQSWLT